MAKRIIKLQQNALPTVAKQKVAAYVRVSEQSEDLLRSYASGMRRLFGYKPVDGEYVVVEKEAEIVRRIFNMFNNGFTVPQICRILNSEGLKTQTGREFLDVNVDYLLKNEMYIGDRLTYKYYTENSLTHRCVRNHGEVEQLYIQGDHAAIVDEDVFYKAQEMMKKRSDAKIISHPFTNLIFCGYCGSVVYKKAYPAYTTYACKSKTKNRNSCIMKRLNEVVLYDIAAKAMRITVFDPFKVREQIKKVTIYNDRIEIEMQNGGQSTWQR